MVEKKEYCLVIEERDREQSTEVKKNFIEELLDIVKVLDFEKVRKVEIFRSDNL